MALLIIYYRKIEYPPRPAITDHLYAFRRAGLPCFHLNLAVRDLPDYLFRAGAVDAVLFHNTLLIERIKREHFRLLQKRLAPLESLPVTRGALLQDEHLLMNEVRDFLRRFEVAEVFTVAPPELWSQLYPDDGVNLHSVLTGYLEQARVSTVQALLEQTERATDIGYRATRPPETLGRHGRLKELVGTAARRQAVAMGLSCDISLDPSDTCLGTSWYKFLAGCRWVVGVEGGSDILDPDGRLREAFQQGLELQLEESDKAAYHALSPRHLEACLTRTGQILVEGHYGGVLQPWRHYLPLRRDLSNMKEMLELSRDEQNRRAMTERAYRDVVQSGRYFSERFANQVWRQLGADFKPNGWLWLDRICDDLSWLLVALHARVFRPARQTGRAWLGRLLGEPRAESLVNRLQGEVGP